MIVRSIMSWSIYEPESCVKNNRERCLGLGQMGLFGHLAVARTLLFRQGSMRLISAGVMAANTSWNTMNTGWGTAGPCCSPCLTKKNRPFHHVD
jgi:hypothetical protein